MALDPVMPDAFAPLSVPLLPRLADGAAFRLKIIPQASAALAFNILQSSSRLATTSTAPPDHAAHSSVPPQITLLRDGERVTHIRLECGCGEVFELQCAY